MRPEGWHLIIIIALAILLFGAPKLPGLARSLGQSLRIFRSEVRQMKEEGNDTGDGKSLLVTDQDTEPRTADSTRVPEPSNDPAAGPGESVPPASRTL